MKRIIEFALLLAVPAILGACKGGDDPPAPQPAATYTVGGTISGLTASGLVLQVNGANNIVVSSSATTFSSSNALAGGAAYGVTALTQPATQMCTVTNGSGTVGSVNVTSVAITCVTLSPATHLIQLRTTSNRADLISGGDAMLEIVLPAGAIAATLRVEVDGRNVSSAFAIRSNGRITGLVTDLSNGANVISATAQGALAAKLTVTNHQRGGPVLSGAQVTPFVCATPQPQGATTNTPATNSSGLATEATDSQCSIATEFKLYYRSTAAGCGNGLPDPFSSVTYSTASPPANPSPSATNCFKPFNSASQPSDLASTTLDTGEVVPFVVRVERGTMNRGIYDIVTLFDPNRPWTAVAPQNDRWNGKFLYTFGASTGQPRRQVRPATNWPTGWPAIGRGYMWVVNSMTDSAVNSNRVMMAETVMMMKEHISDTYGPVKFAMGSGCSGGSVNSNMNASIAPGQLDGITISCNYPDSETTAVEVGDCVALVEAYAKLEWATLMTGKTQAEINAKKAAINGHPDHTGCHGWYNSFGTNGRPGVFQSRVVGTTGTITLGAQTNNCQLPFSQVYDPVNNPTGARCSGWDWALPIWGSPIGGGRANQTRDNVGVQYGLNALLADTITAEEFVAINELARGADADGNALTTRTVADVAALPIAYRAGIVMSGKQYAKTAVIDMRGYDDTAGPTPGGATSTIPIHFIWRSFSTRSRLDLEFGDHDNQVMWRFGRNGLAPSAAMQSEAFTVMDAWLTALVAGASNVSREIAVRAAKPATAFDYCLLSSDAAQTTKVTDMTQCNADTFLKPSSSPRQVAGGHLSENILKCQLKPIDVVDYQGKLNGGQIARLQAALPDGVCDWTKPGVGQQDALSPMSFKAGPGGAVLPAAPVSVAN